MPTSQEDLTSEIIPDTGLWAKPHSNIPSLQVDQLELVNGTLTPKGHERGPPSHSLEHGEGGGTVNTGFYVNGNT